MQKQKQKVPYQSCVTAGHEQFRLQFGGFCVACGFSALQAASKERASSSSIFLSFADRSHLHLTRAVFQGAPDHKALTSFLNLLLRNGAGGGRSKILSELLSTPSLCGHIVTLLVAATASGAVPRATAAPGTTATAASAATAAACLDVLTSAIVPHHPTVGSTLLHHRPAAPNPIQPLLALLTTAAVHPSFKARVVQLLERLSRSHSKEMAAVLNLRTLLGAAVETASAAIASQYQHQPSPPPRLPPHTMPDNVLATGTCTLLLIARCAQWINPHDIEMGKLLASSSTTGLMKHVLQAEQQPPQQHAQQRHQQHVQQQHAANNTTSNSTNTDTIYADNLHKSKVAVTHAMAAILDVMPALSVHMVEAGVCGELLKILQQRPNVLHADTAASASSVPPPPAAGASERDFSLALKFAAATSGLHHCFNGKTFSTLHTLAGIVNTFCKAATHAVAAKHSLLAAQCIILLETCLNSPGAAVSTAIATPESALMQQVLSTLMELLAAHMDDIRWAPVGAQACVTTASALNLMLKSVEGSAAAAARFPSATIVECLARASSRARKLPSQALLERASTNAAAALGSKQLKQVPSYVEGFMALSAVAADVAVMHDWATSLLGKLEQQQQQRRQQGGGSLEPSPEGGGGGGFRGSANPAATNAAQPPPPLSSTSSSSSSSSTCVSLLTSVVAHFDQHCLWTVMAHYERLLRPDSAAALGTLFSGLSLLLSVTSNPDTGHHLPRKLGRLHFVELSLRARPTLQRAAAVAAAAAAASVASAPPYPPPPPPAAEGAAQQFGSGSASASARRREQAGRSILSTSTSNAVVSASKHADAFLSALVGRLAVLSYDGFGSLVTRPPQWAQAGVQALLRKTTTTDDILEIAQQVQNKLSLPALALLACAAKHGDELATGSALSKCVAAAVQDLLQARAGSGGRGGGSSSSSGAGAGRRNSLGFAGGGGSGSGGGDGRGLSAEDETLTLRLLLAIQHFAETRLQLPSAPTPQHEPQQQEMFASTAGSSLHFLQQLHRQHQHQDQNRPQQPLYTRIVQACAATASLRRDDDDENSDLVGGNIVLPLLSNKFPAWFFSQSVALSSAAGDAIISDLLASLSTPAGNEGAGGPPAAAAGKRRLYNILHDDATLRRFAALLSTPSALQSLLSLIDCPQVLLPSAVSCLKWKHTCSQALAVITSLADRFADGSGGAGSDGHRGNGINASTSSRRKNEQSLISTLAETLPAKVEEVLLFSLRALESYAAEDGNDDSSASDCSSGGSGGSIHGGAVGSKSAADETRSWKMLIKSALLTLLRCREARIMTQTEEPTDVEIRIAKICTENLGSCRSKKLRSNGSGGYSAGAFIAPPPSQLPSAVAAIPFEDGAAYVLVILKSLAFVACSASRDAASAATTSIVGAGFTEAVATTISSTASTNVETCIALRLLALLARLCNSAAPAEAADGGAGAGAAGGGGQSDESGSAGKCDVLVDADVLVHLTMPHQDKSVQLAALELWQQLLLSAKASGSKMSATVAHQHQQHRQLPSQPPAFFTLVASRRDGHEEAEPLLEPVVLDRLARGLFASCQSVVCSSGSIVLQQSACSLVKVLLSWLDDGGGGGAGGSVGGAGGAGGGGASDGGGRGGGSSSNSSKQPGQISGAPNAAAAVAKARTLRRLCNGDDWTKMMVESATCIPEQARAALAVLTSLCNSGGRLEQLADQKDLLAVAMLARQGATVGGHGSIGSVASSKMQAVGKEKVMAKAASLASGSRGSGSGSSGGGLFQVLATAADASGWKDVARTLA